MSVLIEMGECPVHGLVPIFRISDTTNPTANTGNACQRCYIEWVKENVTQCVNARLVEDRKSTRLNSSHSQISQALFCLEKNRRAGRGRSRDRGVVLPGRAPGILQVH